MRDIDILPEAQAEIDKLPARFRRPIADAIELLKHQADVATRHRHPMKEEYAPFWQAEIGPRRVFYWYDDNAVYVKSVQLKGSKQTAEVFPKP